MLILPIPPLHPSHPFDPFYPFGPCSPFDPFDPFEAVLAEGGEGELNVVSGGTLVGQQEAQRKKQGSHTPDDPKGLADYHTPLPPSAGIGVRGKLGKCVVAWGKVVRLTFVRSV